MTKAMALRKQMERKWLEPGCDSPLRPARWIDNNGWLELNDDPFLEDEDDPISAQSRP